MSKSKNMRPPTSAPLPLDQLRRAIHAFVLNRIKNTAAADDVTQEVLIRIHGKLETLRSSDRLDAWVFQIARNAVADHFRAARPAEPFDEHLHAVGPVPDADVHELLADEEQVLRRQLAAYVRTVVEGLPEKYRDALRLVEFEGVPQVELARRLGLSVSAAKSRVQRARAMARKEMERCCRWDTDRYGAVVDVHPRRGDCCDGAKP